jgi:WD40 repeat protein
MLMTDEGGAAERRQDWGEAPDDSTFVGRAAEVAVLRGWVLEERCRLVAVVGTGGIGKTSLATRLAHAVAPTFERVYWRSLRDAPPVGYWLVGAIGFLSDQQLVPPAAESERIAALLQLLRERRCLLVLDNLETLFEPGQQEGLYRPGLEGYGRLLLAVGEAAHQSCLVLTSREAPEERAVFHGGGGRTFHVGGLGAREAQVLLAPKQLLGTSAQWAELVARLGGNGLALKLVGETIHERFGGDLGPFLDHACGGIFEGMRRLLAEQVERSSAPEQQVLRVLAVEREPVHLPALLDALGPRVGRTTGLEAIEALRRRSLVERAETPGTATFMLQSVVLEYVTDQMVEAVADEIERGQPLLLVEQPLIQAQAKDYVRQAQERLIGAPVLERLKARHGEDGTQQLLLALLDSWRGRPCNKQDYGPGNVVNLLRLLRGDLRGLDLSRLAIRHAYLAEVEAQVASLAGSHLAEAVLADAFSLPVSVALSRDGALLAVGTSTRTVWLWRVADRTLVTRLEAHAGGVVGVALSPDGHLLASGDGEGTIRLWDLPSGRPLAILRGHSGVVWGVALARDGHLLASGSGDGTVRLWDAGSGQSLATLHGHTGAVWGVALSADGHLLASAGGDGTVRLWDAQSGQLLATLRGHTSMVRCVALTAAGQLLASAGEDGMVRLWNPGTGQLLATLPGHTSAVRGVALTAAGQLLASGSEDGTVRLWETSTRRPVATLPGHTSAVWGVALSADGHLLASAGLEGRVRLWELPSGRSLATLQGYTNAVWGVALSADGHLLASAGGAGAVRLWDARTGQPAAPMQGHAGGIAGVALSADGQLLASGSEDGLVRLWEASTGRPVATLSGHTGAVWGVALARDGHLLASGGGDGTVRLWDLRTGQPLTTLQGHAGAVRGVALSADGDLLASGGGDGTVRLWDPRTGQPLATLRGHAGGVWRVALSADGRLLASADGDGTVRLWEPGTQQLLAALVGHTGGALGVALSADGSLLASSGVDGLVRLWETGTGQLLATLEGHTGGVLGLALSADGQLLASSGVDGLVRLWETRGGTCLHLLRSARRYERLDITGLTGITEAQRAALLALGAVEQHGPRADPRAPVPLESVR